MQGNVSITNISHWLSLLGTAVSDEAMQQLGMVALVPSGVAWIVNSNAVGRITAL